MISRVEIDPLSVEDPNRITPNHKLMSTGLLALDIDLAFEHEQFNAVIAAVVMKKIVANNFVRFGCCNAFVECSDNKKCLHEGNLEYMGCYYRENLMKGRIFYGKNAQSIPPEHLHKQVGD